MRSTLSPPRLYVRSGLNPCANLCGFYVSQALQRHHCRGQMPEHPSEYLTRARKPASCFAKGAADAFEVQRACSQLLGSKWRDSSEDGVVFDWIYLIGRKLPSISITDAMTNITCAKLLCKGALAILRSIEQPEPGTYLPYWSSQRDRRESDMLTVLKKPENRSRLSADFGRFCDEAHSDESNLGRMFRERLKTLMVDLLCSLHSCIDIAHGIGDTDVIAAPMDLEERLKLIASQINFNRSWDIFTPCQSSKPAFIAKRRTRRLPTESDDVTIDRSTSPSESDSDGSESRMSPFSPCSELSEEEESESDT